MKIYWIKAQAPRRVMALVKHLGIEAELIEMTPISRLKTPDYGALNPNMTAPTLVDGDFVLWESSAINAYLCTKVGSDMWPANDPAGQVQVLRWLSWADQHWNRATGPYYFEHVVKPTFGIGEPDRDALVGAEAPLRKHAAVLDGWLQGKSHVALDRLTIADFQLASQATYWRTAEMPLEAYPNIVRWLDGLMDLPAWAAPWPEQEDAFLKRAAVEA
ncbi:glutathione S-transferase family protein [Asticcacaulis solisilvae]|uniref:glutathione S-transferase family protein n=1 Tax=Asticcacaulis solisilvae TaxID=1217274 RepID=UPI003FD81E5C